MDHGAHEIVEFDVIERGHLYALLERGPLSHKEGLHFRVEAIPSVIAQVTIASLGISFKKYGIYKMNNFSSLEYRLYIYLSSQHSCPKED